MRSPNRTAAVLSALLLLVAGLVPASAAAFCAPAADCDPCAQLPADARIVAACCCCGDLAAAGSTAPDVAEGAGEGSLNAQSYHATASPVPAGRGWRDAAAACGQDVFRIGYG